MFFATVFELSLRVNSPDSERSNSVYLVGMARTTKLTRMTSTSTTAANAAAYTPLRKTRPPSCGFGKWNLMRVPSSQFQRRFSMHCAVKNRNRPITER